MYYLSNVISLVLVIGVWTLTGRSDQAQILNFILIGNFYFSLTSLSYKWVINRDILTGTISSKLVRPSSIWVFYMMGSVAASLRIVLINLVSLSLVLSVFREYLSWNWSWSWLWIFPFLATSFMIKFCLDVLVGMLAFWLTSADGPIQIYEVSHTFLAGGVIPFGLLASNYHWLEYQPLAYTLLHPTQSLLGTISFSEAIVAWLVSLIWAIGLWILVQVVFRLGLKKYESVGL